MKIEQNIPLPAARRTPAGYNSKYPFAKLTPGDSFLIPLPADPKKARAKRVTISGLMLYHARKRGAKYASRRLADGLRVWRIS